MRRLVTFTLALEIEESTFDVGDPILTAQEVDDMTDLILPNIAQQLAREAKRVLEFHADGPRVAAISVVMSEAYDPDTEPF